MSVKISRGNTLHLKQFLLKDTYQYVRLRTGVDKVRLVKQFSRILGSVQALLPIHIFIALYFLKVCVSEKKYFSFKS